MAHYLLQFFTPEEFENASGIMSETSSILDDLSDSDSDVSDSVHSGVEESPKGSGTHSCDKQATPSQRKPPVSNKTPDATQVKPKVCFPKSNDTIKSRFDARKEPDLVSSAGDGKELRKRPLIYKTPDYSKVKPKVCFGKNNDTAKSRFGARKEPDLVSSAGDGKELRKRPLIYKTPDYSKVKPKVCFGKNDDTAKSRFGARKEPDLVSSAGDGKELRKQPLHYKTPDYSKVKPKVRFPTNSYTPPKSRFHVKKESDLPSCADTVKEVTLCQEEDTLLLQQTFYTLLMKRSEMENALDELRFKVHDPVTSLTSSESAKYETDERTSDVSRKENQMAAKFTQTPADTNRSAPAGPAGGDSERITCWCCCSCCGRPKADVNCKRAVRPELRRCVAACTPPHRFCSGRGQTETSSPLDRAVRIAGKLKKSCNRMVDRNLWFLSELRTCTGLSGPHD